MAASAGVSELGSTPTLTPSVQPAEDAARREQDAHFRALYETHFKLVWGSLRRLGVREPDVMDLTQKVFFIVHSKLPGFEGRSQLSTWLVSICQRVASDYRRSAVVRREVVTESQELDRHALPLATLQTATDPGGAAHQQHLALAEAILNRLPDAQRSVFVLYELEELSAPEIAQMLDLSVGTVRSRLRLARESFARETKRLAAQGNAHKETP